MEAYAATRERFNCSESMTRALPLTKLCAETVVDARLSRQTEERVIISTCHGTRSLRSSPLGTRFSCHANNSGL